MSIYELPLSSLDGSPAVLEQLRDKAAIVVNVASKCGMTPQYAGLQSMYDELAEQGFTVLGVPCNQFLDQEPGTAEEIAEFCSVNYGVTFPMAEKVEVNGDGQHPLFAVLNAFEGADGHSGDIRWNFEKFVVNRNGDVIARFGPQVDPYDPEVVAAVEAALS
ncbi:MAG: glutathione peroxidase [Actinomycetes bacterium]